MSIFRYPVDTDQFPKIATGIFFAIPLFNFLSDTCENVAVIISYLLFVYLFMSCDKQVMPKSVKMVLPLVLLRAVNPLLSLIGVSIVPIGYVLTSLGTLAALAVFLNSNFSQGIKILALLFVHRYVFDRIVISQIGSVGYQWYAGCLSIAFLSVAIMLLYRWKDYETHTFDNQNSFLRALNIQGRIGRKSYLIAIFCFLIAFSFALFFDMYCVRKPTLFYLETFVHPILYMSIFFMVAQSAKRCHDIGRSGWYQFIPLLNLQLLFKS